MGILTAVAERVPPLADPSGWNARFGRELNATDDRPHFIKRLEASASILPVVEGKQLSPFQVDVGRSAFGIPIAAAAKLVPERPP